MSESKTPGIKACHCIITKTCRMNRSDMGAFDEAVERLRQMYLDCLPSNSQNPPDTQFHLVLTVDRPSLMRS